MATVRAAIVRRVRDAFAHSSRVVVEDLWPLVQATAAATAWLIARRIIHHHEPFFAPISALVSLNTSLGERGLNGLRLLQGVVLGVVVGELTLLALGDGYGSLAVGTFLAMAAARALGGARIMLAQAAVGAILTISAANGEVGTQRLIDALIGAGVALVFSQLLFSPEPLRLLRRVEKNALAAMAAALDLTAATRRSPSAPSPASASFATTCRSWRGCGGRARGFRVTRSSGALRSHRSCERTRTRAISTCSAAAAYC